MKASAIEKKFELLSRMMEEDFIYLAPNIGFDGACLIIGADPRKMNDYALRTFGISGSGIFTAYRSSYRRRLFNKYRRGVVIE